jgi:hypothetical protein
MGRENNHLARAKRVCLRLVLALLVLTPACSISIKPGYIEDDKKSAEAAIDKFHEQFNSGQYQEIYNDAHDAFKRAIKQSDALSRMAETADRFGKMEHVDNREMNVIIGAPIQVRAVYETKFEKGDSTEVFLFLKDGDAVRLAMYQIFPGKAKDSITTSASTR